MLYLNCFVLIIFQLVVQLCVLLFLLLKTQPKACMRMYALVQVIHKLSTILLYTLSCITVSNKFSYTVQLGVSLPICALFMVAGCFITAFVTIKRNRMLVNIKRLCLKMFR